MAAIFTAPKWSRFVEAVLGAKIDVPLLDGQHSLDIPASVQPDAILRIVGKGLPCFGRGPRSDLYVRLQVHVPERLTDRQRRLYEQCESDLPQQAKLAPEPIGVGTTCGSAHHVPAG